jgi:hypothetical protein
MKHIKLYENLLDEYYQKKKELKGDRDKILSMIDLYIKLNKDNWENFEILKYGKCVDFSVLKEHPFFEFQIIYHSYDDKYEEKYTHFNSNEYKDFLKFMDDPELYTSTKKYNL